MNDERRYWLDEPRNVTKVFWGVVILCGLLVLPDFFYQPHGHFRWESWFGFSGWYGFVSCIFLVLAAKQLRRILMRDDDYYD